MKTLALALLTLSACTAEISRPSVVDQTIADWQDAGLPWMDHCYDAPNLPEHALKHWLEVCTGESQDGDPGHTDCAVWPDLCDDD